MFKKKDRTFQAVSGVANQSLLILSRIGCLPNVAKYIQDNW